ncbi:MAG: AAA family ATPase [Bacteroidota bacterium]
MLIRFTFDNFKSFKEEVELSMVAGRSLQHPDHKILLGGTRKLEVLRTAAIFGKNASGKSNLIKALSFAKDLILRSPEYKQTIPVTKYRLDDEYLNKPSSFKFELAIDNTIYSYGFSVTRTEIVEEWLYEIKSTTETVLFIRKGDKITLGKIDYSHWLNSSNPSNQIVNQQMQRLYFVGEDTRRNQLFLTASVERDQPYFKSIYKWFESSLYIIRPDSKYFETEFQLIEGTNNFSKDFEEILKQLDTDIEGIHLDEVDVDKGFVKAYPYLDLQELINKMEPGSRAMLPMPDQRRFAIMKDKNGNVICYKLMTKHKKKFTESESLFSSGGYDLFEINWESQGTQRLLDLIPYLFLLKDSSVTFVVDELARSLHPEVSYKLVKSILENRNLRNSQLIFSTHEDYLLDFDLLRRDEIWFADKKSFCESSLYSLEEFKPRYDKDIRRGYLRGRFGGIPQVNERALEKVLSQPEIND